MTKTPRPWTTRSRELILDHGPFLRVENHVIELPDGQVIEDWSWVIAPDAVIVIVVTADDRFLCFRQTKYAVKGTTLAPVAGMIDPGETPTEAAQRELLEETGFVSSRWTSLGSYVLEPNRGVSSAHLFLAQQAHKVAEPNADDLEDQILLTLERNEIESALQTGEFKVVTWAAAFALGLMTLDREQQTD
jgi:ADP-ribose pyrophosphatase